MMMLAGVLAFSMIGCGGNDAETEEPSTGDEIVDVEGEAKYNGWRFIATIDHHEEGNVISGRPVYSDRRR